MATDHKVSVLPAVDSLDGTELLYVDQGGVDKNCTPDDIIALAPTSSGTMNLVQLSDGAGGFTSDAGLAWDSGSNALTINQMYFSGLGITGTVDTNLALTSRGSGKATLDGGGIVTLGLDPVAKTATLFVGSSTYTSTDWDDGFTTPPAFYIDSQGDLGKVDKPFGTGYFATSVETVALNASGNVDAATFSVASTAGIDGTITTADGAYTFTGGLLTAFTPA